MGKDRNAKTKKGKDVVVQGVDQHPARVHEEEQANRSGKKKDRPSASQALLQEQPAPSRRHLHLKIPRWSFFKGVHPGTKGILSTIKIKPLRNRRKKLSYRLIRLKAKGTRRPSRIILTLPLERSALH
jgi:hypothetical protein